jgi:hypothetical protein
MPRERPLPPPTEQEMWVPLEQLADRVAETVGVPLVLPCDFMFMHHTDQPGVPRLFHYKHKLSRCSLNLTARGRFARYVPPADLEDLDDDGHYVLTRASMRKVLDAVEIDEWTDWTAGDGYCDGCVLLMERRLGAELKFLC